MPVCLQENQFFCGKSQNVIVKSRGILKQVVGMKSKKLNSAILAGFPCSHRKYIWFYNSGVSSLQMSIIVTSTEKLQYLFFANTAFICSISFFSVIFLQQHSLIHMHILTGVIQWPVSGKFGKDHRHNSHSYLPRGGRNVWEALHFRGIFHRPLPTTPEENTEQSVAVPSQEKRQEHTMGFYQGIFTLHFFCSSLILIHSCGYQ